MCENIIRLLNEFKPMAIGIHGKIILNPGRMTNCLKLHNKFLGKQIQLNKRIHMKELTVRKNGIYLGDGTILVTDVEKPTIIHILSVRNARKLHLEFSLNANVIDFDQKIKIM